MSVQATPDIEWDILIDHEFEIPCDITSTKSGRCTMPATWILVLRQHCADSLPSEQLICETHYRYVVSGGSGYCPNCEQTRVVVRDFVVQLERIKP